MQRLGTRTATLLLAFVLPVVAQNQENTSGPTLAESSPAHARVGDDADRLSAEIAQLSAAGKYEEAVPLAKRYVELAQQEYGKDHVVYASAVSWLGDLYRAMGRYELAEPLLEQAVDVLETALGPDHMYVGTAVGNLALLYKSQGKFRLAEPLYKRSLAVQEKALGPQDAEVGRALNNLGMLYVDWGKYELAESFLRRALSVRENAYGSDHPDFAQTLNNIGGLYWEQEKYDLAEPLYRRALAIREKVFGPDHHIIGESVNNIAELYRSQGKHELAIPLYERAIGIMEKALGPNHPSVAVTLNNLALLYNYDGKYALAEPLIRRALAIQEKVLSPEHPALINTAENLAGLFQSQGKYELAAPFFARALDIGEKSLGADHPSVANSLYNLGNLALAQSRWGDARAWFERCTEILNLRSKRGIASSVDSRSGVARLRNSYSNLVKVSRRLAAAADQPRTLEVGRETFVAAQWRQNTQAADALAQMAVRGAQGNPELTKLTRERQDLAHEWQGKDKLLIASKSAVPEKRDATAEKALSDRLAAIDARIAEIDLRLAREFPDYAALASPKPIAVRDVQASLNDDEALLLFLDTPEFKPLPEETFVWVVTKSELRWLRSELGTAALQRDVAALRCGLDAAAWHGDVKRCTDLLRLTPDKAPRDGEALPFDTARAHALYRSLLGEAEDMIKGKQLLIVPSGALTTLPFQVLVAEPPQSNGLASARWLVREHALTVLPSVASLQALRRTGRPSAAPKPMIGFANPLLDGRQDDPLDGAYDKQQAAAARAQTGCATSLGKRTAALRVVSRSLDAVPLSGGQVADLAHLRRQAPLPETADEVCAVVRSVGGGAQDVRIGAQATEAEVKRLSTSSELAKYRLLHFATHGTLAGQLRGTSEPGLILTPPAIATAEDDGYLSGSEIASLKLDADWVILSACNTAGGAGQGEAAEALSGLARVFFYAGARALLVSHWEVDSDAAVKLVTGAIGEMATGKTIGRAEALRRAMLTTMADTSRPAGWTPAWHPSVWAPFVVVGEGGAKR